MHMSFAVSSGILALLVLQGLPDSGLEVVQFGWNCQGNETSILYCGHRGWGIENCGHYEDASVVCYGLGSGGKSAKHAFFVRQARILHFPISKRHSP